MQNGKRYGIIVFYVVRTNGKCIRCVCECVCCVFLYPPSTFFLCRFNYNFFSLWFWYYCLHSSVIRCGLMAFSMMLQRERREADREGVIEIIVDGKNVNDKNSTAPHPMTAMLHSTMQTHNENIIIFLRVFFSSFSFWIFLSQINFATANVNNVAFVTFKPSTFKAIFTFECGCRCRLLDRAK